jgi:hypothetical protein
MMIALSVKSRSDAGCCQFDFYLAETDDEFYRLGLTSAANSINLPLPRQNLYFAHYILSKLVGPEGFHDSRAISPCALSRFHRQTGLFT